jgi:hypothetical protein
MAHPHLAASSYDHVGIVTNDTVLTAQRWADLYGVSPPSTFNNAGPAGNLTYRGVHTDANVLGAYLGCDGQGAPRGLEILQPSDGHPSFWLDNYHLSGVSPLYLGFASDSWTEADLIDDERHFTSVGCPTDQIGYWWQTKSTRGCYHYMDCRATAFGSNIEVMSRSNCARTHKSTAPSNARLSGWQAVPLGVNAFDSTAITGPPTLRCSDMRHVAVVVPNASATLTYYAGAFGRGVGQVPPLQRVMAKTYRGQPTSAAAWYADLPLHSGFSLRVYQPVLGSTDHQSASAAQPSWWFDGLQRFGPSIHLVSFSIANVSATLAHFGQRGYSVLQRGDCYAYIDSQAALGVVLELREC